MIVNVKYFGIPMAHLRREAQQIELPSGSSIEQLLDLLSDKGDKIEDRDNELLAAATFMVNRTRAEKTTVLNDGDEVIIMYPLGGG